MNDLRAVIVRKEGHFYVLVAQHSEVNVPVKKLRGCRLGQYVDFEEYLGKWMISEAMKKRLEKGELASAAGKAFENEFLIQLPVDINYDTYNHRWRGFNPITGNIFIPADVEWPLKEKVKLEQETWREECYIRRLRQAVRTPHMGKVMWAVNQVISERMPVVKKEKKNTEKTQRIKKIKNPGEKIGVVVGMMETFGGSFTAFVFMRSGDDSRIVQIENAMDMKVGNWVAFESPADLPTGGKITTYRRIPCVLPTKRFNNTIMLKLVNVDVPEDFLPDSVYTHPFLGSISNARDILMPGKGLTIVVEKRIATKNDPNHWVVSQLLVDAIPMCQPTYGNANLIAFSPAVGPKVYRVNKEFLAVRSAYFAEMFVWDTHNGKYDVFGEPKAVGRVLEILFQADLHDATFVEHDVPFLEFWNGLDDIMEVLDYWQMSDLKKFVVEKMILYHCEERQCHHCVNRAAYAFINGLPYPTRRNCNGATVAMWSQECLEQLQNAFPWRAERFQEFAGNDH